MRKLGLLLLILSLVPNLVGCGGGGGATTSAAGRRDGPGSAFDQIPLCVEASDEADLMSEAARLGSVIVSQRQTDKFPALRTRNPKIKLLIYYIASATVAGSGRDSDPIGDAWIGANHPEWYLLDDKGQQIRFAGDQNLIALDPGNPDYQRAFADKAVEYAKAGGADGVYMDNCNDFYVWNFQIPPAKYPMAADGTSEPYAEAMDAFISVVSAKFREAGLLLVCNIGGETWETGRLARWLPSISGFSTEAVSQFGDGSPQEIEERWQKLFTGFQSSPDKTYLQFMDHHPVSERNYRYAVACFLVWKGPDSYIAYGSATPAKRNPMLDMHVGQPLGGPTNIGGKICTREYQNAVVYVNSSHWSSGTITLPSGLKDYKGNTYPAGPRTLGPYDSLILLKS